MKVGNLYGLRVTLLECQSSSAADSGYHGNGVRPVERQPFPSDEGVKVMSDQAEGVVQRHVQVNWKDNHALVSHFSAPLSESGFASHLAGLRVKYSGSVICVLRLWARLE